MRDVQGHRILRKMNSDPFRSKLVSESQALAELLKMMLHNSFVDEVTCSSWSLQWGHSEKGQREASRLAVSSKVHTTV